MGLSERTRYILASELDRLLGADGTVSLERLRQVTLYLDQCRGEIALSLQQHQNEERFVSQALHGAEEAAALWRARAELARSKRKEDLTLAAVERLEGANVRLASLKGQHERLVRSLASLKVTRERLERTLHEVRRQAARCAAGGSLGPKEIESLQEALALAGGSAELPEELDPIEREFRALELDEVAGSVTRGLGVRKS